MFEEWEYFGESFTWKRVLIFGFIFFSAYVMLSLIMT